MRRARSGASADSCGGAAPGGSSTLGICSGAPGTGASGEGCPSAGAVPDSSEPACSGPVSLLSVPPPRSSPVTTAATMSRSSAGTKIRLRDEGMTHLQGGGAPSIVRRCGARAFRRADGGADNARRGAAQHSAQPAAPAPPAPPRSALPAAQRSAQHIRDVLQARRLARDTPCDTPVEGASRRGSGAVSRTTRFWAGTVLSHQPLLSRQPPVRLTAATGAARRGHRSSRKWLAGAVSRSPFARVSVVDQVESTNTMLREAATAAPAAWPHLSVLVAEHQTAGRGRSGRSWSTPRGSALTASILVRPDVPPHRLPWLTLLTGLAVVRALDSPRVGLKWPNDLLVVDAGPHLSGWGTSRKVGGILTEALPAPQPSPASAAPPPPVGRPAAPPAPAPAVPPASVGQPTTQPRPGPAPHPA